MSQFDVYENDDRLSRDGMPYYLDVQSDLLERFATRIVVPLIPETLIDQPVEYLNPMVCVGRDNFYLSSTQLCSVHINRLGKRIANIAHQRDVILSSISVVFDAD